MNKFRRVISIVVLCMATCTICAQNEVSLVVSGEGKNKEEATFNALRSAIEQAYGTFVSANTTILNDQLVADEIVSLSSGNIKKYEYVSENKMPDGNTFVMLSATVSIDKLVTFAESKGMTAELKGGLFAMNLKKMEFDKKAEEKAVENLCKQLEVMLPTLFDYEIMLDEPKVMESRRKSEEKKIGVKFTINVKPTENLKKFREIFCKTTSQIALDDKALENLEKSGNKSYQILFYGLVEHLLKEVFPIEDPNTNYYKQIVIRTAQVDNLLTLKGIALIMNSVDIKKCNKICAPLGLNCQLIDNPCPHSGDPRFSYRKEKVISISPFYLRSQKSVDLLDTLYSKAVESYYNIIINTGLKEVEIKYPLKTSERDRDVLSLRESEDPRGVFWAWPDPDRLAKIVGILYFTSDEIAKVTSISIRKPTLSE